MVGPVENPFLMQKASHYSSEEILGHWVDIAGAHGGLVSVLQPTTLTPMLLLGGKGSGKTHLMRYCSAPVQAARHGGDLLKAIRAERYVGVYVPAEALNTHKFAGKGLDEEAWAAVFGMYFESWLTTSMLVMAREAVGPGFHEPQGDNFSRSLCLLFDVDLELRSLADVLDYLEKLRRRVDFVVNNSAITRDISELLIPFSTGSLVFGMPDLIAEAFPKLNNPTFVYLIDELENFTADQQKLLNTLIRYRKGRSTIKIGARLYGVKTFATLGSGEPIKSGAEFERVELDAFLRQHADEYRAFAVNLVLQRLKQAHLGVGIDNQEKLAISFAELDTADQYRSMTLKLMSSDDKAGRLRPHLRGLARKLTDAQVTEAIASEVVERLRMVDHPLLEKMNAFLFARRWNGAEGTAVATAADVADQAARFQATGRSSSPDYAQALHHFSSDLLAQMYRSATEPLPYAGLDTLIELSQGIPRNLLGILAHIFRRSTFAGERPFADGQISVASQTYGVIEGAKSFWHDAQPDADAIEVRNALEGLALLMRSIRFSDAPSECDLCTFSVVLDRLSERSLAMLRTAENWSNLVKIEGGSKNKNHRSIDAKYQFAPMLAPLWELSHHRRGTIELQADLANAIFDPAERAALPGLVKARIAGMNAPKLWRRSISQTTLL